MADANVNDQQEDEAMSMDGVIDSNDDSEDTWLAMLNNDDLEFTNMLLHYPRVFYPSSFMPLTEDFHSWGRPAVCPQIQPRGLRHRGSSRINVNSPTERTCSNSSGSNSSTENEDNCGHSIISSNDPDHDPYYLCLDWTDTSMAANSARRKKLLQKVHNRQGIERLVVALCDLKEDIEERTHVMDVMESEPDRVWKSISLLGSIQYGTHVERYEARNSHHISALVIGAARHVETLNFLFMFLDYEAISQRLLQQLPTLHTLRFKKCPVFQDEVLDLVRTMETHGRVTSLCFSDCMFLGRTSIVEFMAEFTGRLANVRNLVTLQLNCCDISEPTLCQILQVLKCHPTLACLDVGSNQCATNESINAVASMLSRKRFKLVDLNVSDLWGTRGLSRNLNFAPLFQALATNTKLQRLDFAYNTVRAQDLPHLAHALEVNTALLSVDLRHMVNTYCRRAGNNNDPRLCTLSQDMENRLFRSMSKNHVLQCLRISINESAAAAAAESLHRNNPDITDNPNDDDDGGNQDNQRNHIPSQTRGTRLLSFSRLEFYPHLNWSGRFLLSLPTFPIALWPRVFQRITQRTNSRYHKPQCVPSALYHMLRCPEGNAASLPLAVSIALLERRPQESASDEPLDGDVLGSKFASAVSTSVDSSSGSVPSPQLSSAMVASTGGVSSKRNKRSRTNTTSLDERNDSLRRNRKKFES